MKVNAITLKNGNIIEHEGRLFSIISGDISQPGKGGSYINVTMRDVENGNKTVVRFRTQESVERVRLDQEDYQYLYQDDDNVTLMHTETYEQVLVPRDVFGDPVRFLQDGMVVELETYEGKALAATLPDTAVFEIIEAEPVIKGQTATTSYKPAILDNGVRVMVPPHIGVGIKIVVKTEDGSYVERYKD
ncbi:MAG: elongation factor P [Pseudobdellovibrionaceae bacterium]